MGRDNSPKIRQLAQLARRKSQRASYDRILIICEGTKTEPQYFKEIRQDYRLNTAKVIPSDKPQPQKIVDFALEYLKTNNQWEQVYCVFDRDSHTSFDEALQSVVKLDKKYKNNLKQPIHFIAIPSIPCFEIWLLLHFEYTTSSIQCHEVMNLLRTYMPKYSKGQGGHFSQTKDKLPIAFKHAKQLADAYKLYDTTPCTAVGELVQQLTTLRDE